MQGALALAATGAITLLGLLHLLLHWSQDTKESPIAPTSIPFIGHVIGLMRKRTRYYVELRSMLYVAEPKSKLMNLAETSTICPSTRCTFQDRGCT